MISAKFTSMKSNEKVTEDQADCPFPQGKELGWEVRRLSSLQVPMAWDNENWSALGPMWWKQAVEPLESHEEPGMLSWGRSSPSERPLLRMNQVDRTEHGKDEFYFVFLPPAHLTRLFQF